MIITINGTPGSGKTTLARALAKKYKLKFYSIGLIRRKIAKIFGLSIEEFNEIGKKYSFTDKLVDELIAKSIKDNAVIDGRMAWKFFPNSIKILLLCNSKVAAERLMKDKREGENYKSIKEARKKILERIKNDEERYRKYYGIKNIFDVKNYDIVLDTSKINKREMVRVCTRVIDRVLLE
jgi:cytidylate kinase